VILERIAGQRFSRVLPLWVDYPVALLAGGPSLTPEHFEMVGEARKADRLRVIAINDSYLLAPWADLHYAADAKWHRWHDAGIDKPALRLSAAEVRGRWHAFPGQKCTIQNCGGLTVDDSVHVLRNRDFPEHGDRISTDRGALATGRNSGFQALNLAILAGSRRILLLGFDAKNGPGGLPHWHGDHPVPSPPAAFAEFLRAFSAAARDIEAAGVSVVNCSADSAIDTWPKMTLAEALG